MIVRSNEAAHLWTDSYKVLAALYVTFAAANIPLQHQIWPVIVSDTGHALWYIPAVLVEVGALLLATMAAGTFLTPTTSAALLRLCTARLGTNRRSGIVASLAAVLLAAIAVSVGVLEGFPNSADEYAYLFQAQRFAEGRLWGDVPPLHYTFVAFRTWINDGKVLGQYPPGWSLALAIPIVIGLPALLLNPVLGSVGAAGLASSAWRFPEPAGAPVAIGLYALTPYYLLNAGSFHSHVLSALLIVAFCVFCLKFQNSLRYRWLVLAGVVLGLIGLTRYFSVVLLLPALAYWLLQNVPRHRLLSIAIIGLSGLPMLILLLLYHYLALGDPLKTTYSLIEFDDFALSFAPEDVLYGLSLTPYRLVELGAWTAPVLIVLYTLCLGRKIANRTVAFYDLIFPSFVVGFILFPDLGGNRYGPRYYFDAFPLVLATILSATATCAVGIEKWWTAPLRLHAVLAAGFYILTSCPFALAAFHAQVEARQEPYRLAQTVGLKNAIVIMETASGPGMSANDLVRNDASLDAAVLYARDGADLAALRRLFPGRAIWVYQRPDPTAPGRLVPVQEIGVQPPAPGPIP